MSQTVRIDDEMYEQVEQLQESFEERWGASPSQKDLMTILVGWGIDEFYTIQEAVDGGEASDAE